MTVPSDGDWVAVEMENHREQLAGKKIQKVFIEEYGSTEPIRFARKLNATEDDFEWVPGERKGTLILVTKDKISWESQDEPD